MADYQPPGRRWQVTLFAAGILLCITGAIMMAFGEPALGEDHGGYATVIGILGIGLIATNSSAIRSAKLKK